MAFISTSSDPIQIPMPVREAAFRLFRVRPLGAIAAYIYRFAAKSIGRCFANHENVRAIYLRGGALKNLVPALSDLDFTLIVEHDTKSLLSLRKKYLYLKNIFWMAGEFLVLDEQTLRLLEQSGCSLATHLVSKTVRLEGEIVNFRSVRAPDPRSRWMVAMTYYLQVVSRIGGRVPLSPYNLEEYKRTLVKAATLLEDLSETSMRRMPLEQILTCTFLALDESAKAMIPNLRFEGESSNELSLFFEKVVNENNPSFPISFFLSPAMSFCYYSGLNMRHWFDNLRARCAFSQPLSKELITFSARERAMVHYFLLPGNILSNSKYSIRKEIMRFCEVSFSLVQGNVSTDILTLIHNAVAFLPQTTKIYGLVRHPQDSLTLEKLVESALIVREEVSTLLFQNEGSAASTRFSNDFQASGSTLKGE